MPGKPASRASPSRTRTPSSRPTRSGAFRLAGAGTGVVFVSTPNGYRAVGHSGDRGRLGAAARVRPDARARGRRAHVHPRVRHAHLTKRRCRARNACALSSIRSAPGCCSSPAISFATRFAFPKPRPSGYYELFVKERNAFRTPVFTVPGNHEIFGIERDTSHVPVTHPLYGRAMYRHYLGPDYYSFTRGGVHFVGLNTVDIDDQRYYGHVDSLQLAWLERDLALVPATMPVVTFDHIPFFTTVEGLNGYNDRPPAPSLITVNGQDRVPAQRLQRGCRARGAAQASSRARPRRPHARDGAHRVRDDRREDALQSGLGRRRQCTRGRARVDLGGNAVSCEERRDRCGSLHSARASQMCLTLVIPSVSEGSWRPSTVAGHEGRRQDPSLRSG